jgi:hypothetical protein
MHHQHTTQFPCALLQATIALSGLQAFKITPHNALHISYAKR